MLMKVVMVRKVCCHRPMLRLPVSTALKLRFGKSVAAQLLPLVINTTLLIAGAVQGCDSVLPALHTLTGSWALFLSMCLCLCTHTHTEQCTPNNHKEEEHNLYPRETGCLLGGSVSRIANLKNQGTTCAYLYNSRAATVVLKILGANLYCLLF